MTDETQNVEETVTEAAPEASPVKSFYSLLAGLIVFVNEGSTEPLSIPVNALLINSSEDIRVMQLERAQGALQGSFLGKMAGNPAKPQVLDVVVTNISPLGWFTEQEFHYRPAPPSTEAVEEALQELQS